MDKALDLGADNVGFYSRPEQKNKKPSTGDIPVVLQWTICLSASKCRLPPKLKPMTGTRSGPTILQDFNINTRF